MSTRAGLVLGVLLAIAPRAGAQDLAPGTTYRATIPTLQQVVGHEIGAEITSPEGIALYLRALAAAAPDRAHLIEYGRTWEGRPLHLLVIGSPARIAELERVQADLRRLADPRALSSSDADRLVRELPVVVWLMHAVHGNEISSSDAALAEAYHLLAAENDPVVDRVMRETIVLIDPLQNPDGRARFVVHTLLGRAAEPDSDPAAAERDEPWPGGRSNHYLFDMNRDWFAQSQVETRARVALALSWYPHVVVDLHEMGGEQTYYFAPPADPVNPYITPAQSSWLDAFGRANAARFDERGFPYFIREIFDSFYPGYGESWPLFHGAIGMTYEQASARGLVYRRRDGSLLTYRAAVVQHFTAALTTMATAAANREKLLRDFLEYRRSAVAEGERTAPREYVLVPGIDRSRAPRLARQLAAQGIEVRRTAEPLRAGGRTVAAGAFLVAAAQPAGRLVRNLLEPHVAQPQAFVEEQDRRRRRRDADQIYDVTSWSLPLLHDVEVLTLERPSSVRAEPFAADQASAVATAAASPRVAYVVPWGVDAAVLTAALLRDGIKVRHAARPFTLGGRRFEAGSAVIRVADHDEPALARVRKAAARLPEVELVAADSGWVDEGISLGSSDVVALKAPRVLLAWDAPASSLSAGWARYVLERRFEQPVTAVRVSSMGRVLLSEFDVVVLPQGDYGVIGDEGIRRLRDWVRAGGTLVTIGEASRWAAGEKVALLETRTELRDGRPEGDPEKDQKPPEPLRPFDLDKAIQPERERPEHTPGALLRVGLDREHWLSAGHDDEIQVIVEGRRVFTPMRLDKGRNVGVFAAGDRLVASGLIWDEARDQLSRKAFLMAQRTGRGHVIAFAEDPNYRAFGGAAELLFFNAVLLAPGR